MRVVRKKKKVSPWFHSHVHTEFSSLDAISNVDPLFAKAAKMKQPAIATTDHGNMSVTVQAYKAAKKYGLIYYPGLEGYLTAEPIVEPVKGVPAPPRFHMGLLALNLDGYRNVAHLSSLSHSRPRFNRFPRFDLADLADHASEDVAILTGCYFGLVQQTLITKGVKPAKRVVEMYARWFPNTFVEIQNHNIDHKQKEATDGSPIRREFRTDEDICEALVEIADELGLPVMVTQDSHYCDSKQKVAHELMKRMVYKGGDESEFPGDSFHLASTTWVEEHHDPAHWERALEGAAHLLELNEVEFPALDKYKARVPTLKKNPQKWLERQCWAGLDDLEERGLLVKGRKWYDKRMKHELNVIGTLGHAG